MLLWLLGLALALDASASQDVCLSDGQSLPMQQVSENRRQIEYTLADHWVRVPRTSLGSSCDGTLRTWHPLGDEQSIFLGGSVTVFGAPGRKGGNTSIRLLDGQRILVERGLVRSTASLPRNDAALLASIDPNPPPRNRVGANGTIAVVLGVAAVATLTTGAVGVAVLLQGLGRQMEPHTTSSGST